ncbi:hypothetical protein BKA67DRAFT_650261 [Truncatella angustata]|uniref:GH16 domain-containing protein n=1 Tax=Truncatella angustata TaxID=152316 RepID=A0A9P8RJA6_9PEZI|nr:uncharacterized protein BKA67DRAFT_650261 [Truncatella angustata]KAH6647078.1 hypothetical protein BKA67DRAFT_650261 [Truncatella angustata]KAH8194339.1 hypothetical protein TruAng_011499 [Truncatella angustata]
MEQQPFMAAAPKPRIPWAKPEDWDKYQNTITALFMCHSLPVVMRVMRDEHQFNATAKMFQTQIYQKWGLRKTKPGEAKKQAKEKANKRRREESEEVESAASSSRSHELPTADNFSISGKSAVSHSSDRTAPNQTPQAMPRSWAANQNNLTKPARNAVDPQAVVDRDRLDSTEAPSDSQWPIPHAWKDFLNKGQVPLQHLEDEHDYTNTLIEPESQIESQQFTSEFSRLPRQLVPKDDWMETVMTLTPPRSKYSDPFANSGSSNSSDSSHTSASPSSRDHKRPRHLSAFDVPSGFPRHLSSPDTLLRPEKSMFFARHFISTTFSTGLWALSQTTDSSFFDMECSKLEKWYNDFNPAFEFLREKKVKRAFRVLKQCFDNTKAIIEPQDPRVMIYVIQQVIRCMYYDTLGRNLAQTLLKYITGLCQVIFGRKHPLYVILSHLACTDVFEFGQNIRPFMDCYFDHLEPFLEQSTNAFGHITEMRGLTVSLMEGTGMMGVYEAKPILEKLVGKADELGLSSLHLRVETAAILHRNRFFDEALELLTGVREQAELNNAPYELMYAGIVMMLTLRKMGDKEGAIRVGYEMESYLMRPVQVSGPGLEMSMSVRQYIGSRQSSFLLVLGKLEKELRDVGRIQEADQVLARLDRGIIAEYGVNEDYAVAGGDEDSVAEYTENPSSMPLGNYLNQLKAKAEELNRKHNLGIPIRQSNPSQGNAQYAHQSYPGHQQPHYQAQWYFEEPQPNHYKQPPPVPMHSHPSGNQQSGPQVYWHMSTNAPVGQDFEQKQGHGEPYGWGNNELENYTASPENSFYTSDGKLILRAIARPGHRDLEARFTSARLVTRQTLSRPKGCLTAWLTMPAAEGIWPAFWMLPREPFHWPDEGEVDIAESWNGEVDNHSCLHWGFYNGEDAQKHLVRKTPIPDKAHRAVRFDFVWNCEAVRNNEDGKSAGGGRLMWLIDGRPVMKNLMPAGTRRIEDWCVLLNVAMGGTVCQGKIPREGIYDLVVHSLQMSDELDGGWARFEHEWHGCPDGAVM